VHSKNYVDQGEHPSWFGARRGDSSTSKGCIWSGIRQLKIIRKATRDGIAGPNGLPQGARALNFEITLSQVCYNCLTRPIHLLKLQDWQDLGRIMTISMSNKGKEKQYLLAHPEAYENAKHNYFNSLDKAVSLCRSVSGSLKCLDIGSGMGLFLVAMHERGHRACGVEPQADLIERAKENCRFMGFEPDIREGCAEDISFPDDYFDIIISNSVMEHVQDWEVAAEECIRCLKPGGVLFVETTNRQHPRQWEVNNFPFFSWLPHRFQRRYVRYCLEKRPDKINHTPIPVRFFFTHRQLKKKFRKLECIPYDRYDLFNPTWFQGRKSFLAPLARTFKFGPVKWLLYFVTPMTKLFIVKAPPADNPS
jgi:SAM-dependent methyltransferase